MTIQVHTKASSDKYKTLMQRANLDNGLHLHISNTISKTRFATVVISLPDSGDLDPGVLPPHVSYYLKSITPTLMQHMHSDPVTQRLLDQGHLSELDTHCMEGLVVSKQVEYLIDRLLLPGDLSTLCEFVEALRLSAYPVNLLLARLMEVGLEEGTDTGAISQEFLSSHEKDEIIEHFYQPFTENGDLDNLIKHLESLEVIDCYHIHKVTQLSLDTEKAGFLFDEVLLRGTYQTLEGFRQALVNTHQGELAELLPHRTNTDECV